MATTTPTLTDAEWREFQSIPDQGYSHRGWVERIVAARVAEAVEQHSPGETCAEADERAADNWQRAEQERAARLALAAKIEALAVGWERDAGPDSEAWRVFGPQTVGVPFAVATLRALLSADDNRKA